MLVSLKAARGEKLPILKRVGENFNYKHRIKTIMCLCSKMYAKSQHETDMNCLKRKAENYSRLIKCFM